jgi:hypothetical protein
VGKTDRALQILRLVRLGLETLIVGAWLCLVVVSRWIYPTQFVPCLIIPLSCATSTLLVAGIVCLFVNRRVARRCLLFALLGALLFVALLPALFA